VVGYHIAVDPGPILAVLPVESDCRGWLVDDIEPTFATSPVLRDKVPFRARNSGYVVREIRIRQASGAYRIIYLTTIGDVVHVLHAFQKKTQATAKRDIDLAKARLRQIG
jgi:hypothetical protein